MSHDIEAAWASAEIANSLSANPGLCLSSAPSPNDISTYAGREGKTSWPHADGLIEVSDASSKKTYKIAVEYKRPNEGLHGILTAFGQAHAYLYKGYAGSLLVLPNEYPSMKDVGSYAAEILNNTSQNKSIGVFIYKQPDRSKVSPFENKISVARNLILNEDTTPEATVSSGKTETQWVHLREGSSDPDAYFRYLQAVKLVSGDDYVTAPFNPPKQIIAAVKRIQQDADPLLYLSYTSGNTMHERAWRYFWYKNILTPKMMTGWKRISKGKYKVNHVLSEILRSDGQGNKQFFSGRSDSNKNKMVKALNTGSKSENSAWEFLAKKFHERAHSYREDIDSGLEKIGFIDNDGRLTDTGYRFLDSCEKSMDPNGGVSKALLAKAILNEGGLGTFLHYVYKLSDEAFSSDPLKFCKRTKRKSSQVLEFDQASYLSWLEDNLANRLHVLRKVSARGGVRRKPFQAELAIMRNFGLVMPGFRVGIGLPINWPEVQKILE